MKNLQLEKFRYFLLAALIPFALSSALASAENLYVRPNGGAYGTENGTSWDNAFDGFSDVAWGSGTGLVGAGDILFVAQGNYTQALSIGASGSSDTNRVTIKAAQDTYVGAASLTGDIRFNSNDYVTLDGGFSGQKNINFVGVGNVVAQGTEYLKIFNVNFTPTGGGDPSDSNSCLLDLRFSGRWELGYNTFNVVAAQWGTPINSVGETHARTWGQASFHHNLVQVPSRANFGNGPDGIQAAAGTDIYNNTFQGILTNNYTGPQHQDIVQLFGDDYARIYNNDFIDSGDSMIDFSEDGGTERSHLYIYNNLFRRTLDGVGTVMIRIYTVGATLAKIDDVVIEGNTFVDGSRTGSSFGAAFRVQATTASTTGAGSRLRNNIFFNTGRGWPVILVEGSSLSQWNISHNLINAGSAGNTNISGIANLNGQTGAPSFVQYAPYAMGNNYQLASGDTSAKDKGTATALYAVDRVSTPRPQGAGWDIGAYEAGVAGGVAPAAPSNLRIGSN